MWWNCILPDDNVLVIGPNLESIAQTIDCLIHSAQEIIWIPHFDTIQLCDHFCFDISHLFDVVITEVHPDKIFYHFPHVNLASTIIYFTIFPLSRVYKRIGDQFCFEGIFSVTSSSRPLNIGSSPLYVWQTCRPRWLLGMFLIDNFLANVSCIIARLSSYSIH